MDTETVLTPTESEVVPTSKKPWLGSNTSTREKLGRLHRAPVVLSRFPHTRASHHPPPPSLSVSSSLPTTPPCLRPHARPATQLPVPLPLGSCPPFHPLPRRGGGPPVRQESAGGSTRLQRPSCPLHSACLPTDWPSCCFHGDHRQSPAPTFHLLPRPPRPYSVVRAATSRLIKQEPREEPGCGPRSQRGGPPRGQRGAVGVGSKELAWSAVGARPAPDNQGLHPLQVPGLCLPWDTGGVLFLMVRLPTMASGGSVPTPTPQQNLESPVTGMGEGWG